MGISRTYEETPVAGLPTVNLTSSYTLTNDDIGSRVVMNSSSDTTITIPVLSYAKWGDIVSIINVGSGVCSIVGSGVNLLKSGEVQLSPVELSQYDSLDLYIQSKTSVNIQVYSPSVFNMDFVVVAGGGGGSQTTRGGGGGGAGGFRTSFTSARSFAPFSLAYATYTPPSSFTPYSISNCYATKTFAISASSAVYVYKYPSEYASSGNVAVYGDPISIASSTHDSRSRLSISKDGSRLAVADWNATGALGRGVVRVYDLSTSNLSQVGSDLNTATLSANGTNYFGYCVSLSDDGSRIAVGYRGATSTYGGFAVYDWSGSAWVQVGSTVVGISTLAVGQEIAISGDGSRVLTSCEILGDVAVYQFSGGAWVQMGGNLGTQNATDDCGRSIAISTDGSRVVFGAPIEDLGATDNGAVFIYDWSGSAWVNGGPGGLAYISGPRTDDNYGLHVGLSGDGKHLFFNSDLGYHTYTKYTDWVNAAFYENIGQFNSVGSDFRTMVSSNSNGNMSVYSFAGLPGYVTIENSLNLVPNFSYPVIVGDGGVGSASDNGGNSVFGGITVIGGGFAFSNGGSGGGSDGTGASPRFGGLGIPGQGYDGGNTPEDSNGAGGGGAGGPGSDSTLIAGGAGGNAASVDINGVIEIFAGGGGGGAENTTDTQGSGGGGVGGQGSVDSPGDGLVNTGSGGGGCRTGTESDGGSGVIILKVPDIFTPTFTAGITSTTTTNNGYKFIKITATATNTESVTFT